MGESNDEGATRNQKRNHLIERVVTAAVGALLLGLQGLNLGETAGNRSLIERIEQLVMQEKAEALRLDQALARQEQMLKVLESQQEPKIGH